MFAKILRRELDRAGLTTYALAQRTGLHRQGLDMLLSGERADPAWSTVQLLALGLGVPLETFRTEKLPAPKAPRPRGRPRKAEAPAPAKAKGPRGRKREG